MKGYIDASGRALLNVEVKAEMASQPAAIDVWVDTGFTGELTLPQPMIDALVLRQSGSVDAILADGSQVELRTYTCLVNWFGSQQHVEVLANDGEFPLLGVGLLLGLELRVNYHSLELTLNRPQSSYS